MGIKLPSVNVGRYLRERIAPLIPGGADVAGKVNGVIKDVQARTAEGENILSATQASLTELNTEEKKKQYLTLALIGGSLLLVLFLSRR